MAISTIKEYIQEAPLEIQELLNQIHEFIIKLLPKEASHTISYKMPTYRYNGNVIHFAWNKNHIGIYPGSETILEFQKDLVSYKTTKAAIQFSLNDEFPFDLLTKIILYNLSKNENAKSPNWHKSQGNWNEAYEFMNHLIVKTNLKKEFKWGNDVYTYNNQNVVGWSGFKNFFSVWFYNGVFLKDDLNVLINANEAKTKGLRQWRFENVNQMNAEHILAYIHEAINCIDSGLKIEKSTTSRLLPSGLLKQKLESDSHFNERFKALTPGRQKEYIEYINEAKLEKTKVTRLEKIIPMITLGIGLNDKYKKGAQ